MVAVGLANHPFSSKHCKIVNLWMGIKFMIVSDRMYNKKRRKTAVIRAANASQSRQEKIREDKSPLPPTSSPSAGYTSTPNGNDLPARENGANPRAIGTNPRAEAEKARAMLKANAPKPGHYDVSDDEILGPEEFAKIKAWLRDPESPVQKARRGADADVF